MCPTNETYRRTEVTYAQLHRVLSSFGISRRRVNGRPTVNVYEHLDFGILITLAAYPESDRVLDYHLVALRTLLDNFGITDPTVFDAELQKAR